MNGQQNKIKKLQEVFYYFSVLTIYDKVDNTIHCIKLARTNWYLICLLSKISAICIILLSIICCIRVHNSIRSAKCIHRAFV